LTAFTADQLTPKSLAAGSPSTVIVANGTGTDWDLHIREIGNVIDEGVDGPQRYKLTYTGHNAATYSDTSGSITPTYIGWAYSADGLTWTKGAAKLISARTLEDPYVVKHGSTYYLYAEDKADDPYRNIRLFTTTDSDWSTATWTDQGDVIDKGASGAWDDQDVSSPTVWIEGSAFKMLFEGRKVSGQEGAVGLATSTDGLTWTKDPANPVFEGGDFTWNTAVVPDDILVAEDGTYVMSYHGKNGSTFRAAIAHSADLYSWTDPLNNVSIRLENIDTDSFFVQFHPVGTDIHFVYSRDAGAGIRLGDDMGYEVLVVNFTGANGSTTFTDESAWAHALSANGNAQIQSNKLELDGSGDYVSSADSTVWQITSLPYTIELFGVEFDTNTSTMTLIAQWTGTSHSNQSFRFDYRGDLTPDILRILGYTTAGTPVFFFDDSSAWTPTVGTAYDICIERSGTTLRFYINGTMLSSTTQSEAFRDASAQLLIGASKDTGSASLFLDGRMKAVRFTNGKALYANDGGYTVPSLPL
jgi:hypothetical protein